MFPRRTTGASLAPVVAAADAFLACLTPEQRRAATLDLDTPDWRSWCNMHPYIMRHGVCLDYLEAPQQEAALALLRASLSEDGFNTARNVMKLNEHLREITNRPQEYGEWFYWLSIMGDAVFSRAVGLADRWSSSHVNCFMCGDQMVLTPTFMGRNPSLRDRGSMPARAYLKPRKRKGWRS